MGAIMTNPTTSMMHPENQEDAAIDTTCQWWQDSVSLITDDLRDIYFRMPSGSPFEIEIRNIVNRLQIANENAAASLVALSYGHERH